MKKIIFLLSFLVCAIVSVAQYPIVQTQGSDSTIVKSKAAYQAVKGFVNGRFSDTTSANLERIRQYAGAQIAVGNDIWLRNSSATAWILQGTGGSLTSTVTIVDSNHIQICNINGCDTITITNVEGDITNITIINDTTLQVCGSDILGSELVTNGGFTGGATGWTLGNLWAYDVNNVVHSYGDVATLLQSGSLTEGGSYYVSISIGGVAGTVVVALDAGSSQSYSAGAGTVTFTGTWNSGAADKIIFTPSIDFDGPITDVSIKQILPNCDTLQIQPTNIPIPDTIFVQTPLHAFGTDDDSIYMTQAGPTWSNGDSGWLSTAGYDTFYYKVDSLTHSAANNSDILQFIKNGVVTNWDTLDIVCYGLTNPGDVIWSGTGLVYNVTSANYRIDCKPYISPPTQITLTAADATNPRVDVVYVDSSGNAGLLTGTAAAAPVTPQIDPSYQVYLTSILVPAVATIAPIDTAVIYDENSAAPTNWTPITNGGTTTNAANTLNVWRGALSLDVTNINNGDLINFPRGASIDLSAYQSVVGFIKLKAVLPTAANIRILWFNGGSQIGSTVILLLNKSNITTYQAFSVPLTSFAFTQTVVDRFQISYTSNNANVYLGFYADFIYLQNGVAPSPVSGTIVGYNYLTHVKNNGIDSIRLGGIGTQTLTTLDSRNGDYQIQVLGDAGNTQPLFYATGGAQGLSGTGTSVGVTGTSPLVPLWGINTATNTATIGPALVLNRLPSGSGAAGLGASIQVNLPDASGSTEQAGLTQIKWTTATNLTETSAFEILLRNAGASAAVKASLSGPGKWTWSGYGVGAFTGTTAFGLGVDASGNVIEIGGSSFPTMQQVFNTEVGGSVLTKVDTISAGANYLYITGSKTGSTSGVLFVNNTDVNSSNAIYATSAGTNAAIYGNGTTTGVIGAGAIGVNAIGTTNVGIAASATSGAGGTFTSTSGIGASVTVNPSSTSSVVEIEQLYRKTSGTSANGIGGKSAYYVETTTGAAQLSNELISKWTDATNATRTSQFDITGVNSAATETFANFQTGGIVRVNNLADTLSTKAYARSLSSGGGNTIYTADDAIASDRTVDLNGKILQFQQDGIASIYTDVGHAWIQSFNNTDDGNNSRVVVETDVNIAAWTAEADFNDGDKIAKILANATASAATIVYTADTHTIVGGLLLPYTAQTGTYSVLTTDYFIDCTSGTFTATLPTAAGVTGHLYVIKNSGAGTITIATTGGQTIDGAATQTLSVQYSSYTLISDGANWKIY